MWRVGWVYFYFGMVWGDAEADEAVGDREGFIHVDARGGELREHAVGGVEAGGAGADDGHTERGMAAGGSEEAGVEGKRKGEGGERGFLEEEGGHWAWWGGVVLYVGRDAVSGYSRRFV